VALSAWADTVSNQHSAAAHRQIDFSTFRQPKFISERRRLKLILLRTTTECALYRRLGRLLVPPGLGKGTAKIEISFDYI